MDIRDLLIKITWILWRFPLKESRDLKIGLRNVRFFWFTRNDQLFCDLFVVGKLMMRKFHILMRSQHFLLILTIGGKVFDNNYLLHLDNV
jgi:hypothetical protein